MRVRSVCAIRMHAVVLCGIVGLHAPPRTIEHSLYPDAEHLHDDEDEKAHSVERHYQSLSADEHTDGDVGPQCPYIPIRDACAYCAVVQHPVPVAEMRQISAHARTHCTRTHSESVVARSH